MAAEDAVLKLVNFLFNFYCIQHFYTLHYVFGIAVQACSLLTCVVTGCETAHLSTFSDLSCSLVSHDKD